MNKPTETGVCLLRKPQAIVYNIGEIRRRTKARIIAVIKQDGYGTGLLWEYRQCLRGGIDFFAVNTIGEAKALREAGCREDILLLSPVYSVIDCILLIEMDVILMLESRRQAEVLRETWNFTRKKPRVHLAIDTGLGRYGFYWETPEDILDVAPWVTIEGCYTHMATRKPMWRRQVRRQKQRFEKVLAELTAHGISPGLTHAAASRTFAAMGDLGFDAIRVGSLLLGRPGCRCQGSYQDAVCLQAPVFSAAWRKRGSTLGYDAGCRLRRDTLVGLLRVGNSDGICLGAGNGGAPDLCRLLAELWHLIRRKPFSVTVNGHRLPVLGKMGMEFMLVDLKGEAYHAGDVAHIAVNPLLVPAGIPRRTADPILLQAEGV